MTVDELMAKLGGAFPLFNQNAMDALAPVYRARLGEHEGKTLYAAYVEVLASFVPTSRAPFPLPKDFPPALPARGLKLADTGPSIRSAMEDRRKAVPALVASWWSRQGIKIEGARGYLVADACRHIVMDLANVTAWTPGAADIILSPAQIQTAEDRAVSRRRVAMFGTMPKTGAAWEAQMNDARRAMQMPRPPRPSSVRKSTTRQAAE